MQGFFHLVHSFILLLHLTINNHKIVFHYSIIKQHGPATTDILTQQTLSCGRYYAVINIWVMFREGFLSETVAKTGSRGWDQGFLASQKKHSII